MDFRRRSFLGSAGGLLGMSLTGVAFAQGRAPVTRDELDEMILRARNAERFACTRSRDADEGPFYNPSSPLRRDITEGLEGEALRLRIRLGGLSGRGECRPLVGAVIDLWQGDAHGVYSNVGENIQQRATPGATFMRGHQITDDQGMVEFDTVVPGWEVITAPPPENFTVRTTHIHVKIYHEWQVFDAQLYFPDELIDSLYAEVEPYRSNNTLALPGTSQQISRVRNVDDEQFRIVEATPMAIERVDGRLVADAVIGRAFAVNRGIPSMYGR